jgi:NADP-reducing hydrogenase subunit HndB
MAGKIKNLDDLKQIKEKTQKKLQTRHETGTKIIIGMGTCGIAAGARDTMKALLQELEKNDIEANVSTVGCIGMCANEPLLDIMQNGVRVTYGKITKDKVPTLVREHLRKGNIVQDWVVGKVVHDQFNCPPSS